MTLTKILAQPFGLGSGRVRPFKHFMRTSR
jgi:hypothetical protein